MILFGLATGLKKAHSGSKQCHYYYRHITKANGLRLLEIPKSRLREIQRTIYSKILSQVPVHDCVHAYVKGRSIRSFAAPHVSKAVVLTMDLKNFFTSIYAGRVFNIFNTLGYDKSIAATLAGCCVHQTPHNILKTIPPSDRLQLLTRRCFICRVNEVHGSTSAERSSARALETQATSHSCTSVLRATIK